MTVTAFASETEKRFALARQVADAVLFEGYVLYPYRASAAKNRLRWQFGVLVPPGWGAECEEHDFQHTECLMEPKEGATLSVEVRFLHARRRTVQRARADGGFDTVAELRLDDRVLVPWDEGGEERVEVVAKVDELLGDGVTHPFRRPAREDTEPVLDAAGRTVGRLVRRCEEISGTVRLSARELDGPYRALRLTAVVENTSDWTPREGRGADRDAALPHSLVATHLLMALSAGSFLSMTDPPEWAKGAVAGCRNLHTWPVLAGEPGSADLVLSSPIILEDHPAIAPESPGALYDATEIDEILALRTAALTDEEKREARGTDERAAAVIELADSMPAEVLERLHGAVRSLREVTGPDPTASHDGFPDEYGVRQPDTPWWDPASDEGFDPERDRVVVDGRPVGKGTRVELRPGLRHTDAQDIFLQGRTAKVEAVLHDVDGGVHLAVTVEGDPGADIRREQGRFLYFQPDEVTPLEDDV
ncbi:hypothetical protein [Streptomyces resistomycificus]|uniref:Uncharacterized protein n=1 Tax=Streptomyces resistomycificus TaxID=67356 RepID=A0A0L8L026_9ACTN|nr:hypothetical protein [Streptomyces resistomycificus]KOG31573.1 hypothetical protein ADK37_30285 [Streptomyces resistomycificus]KUO00628.1 hypothetical protein AQJ84_06380 [Streptomyces resistomycificus]